MVRRARNTTRRRPLRRRGRNQRRKLFNGGIIQGSNNPRTRNLQPWSPLQIRHVLEVGDTGSADITFKNIVNWINQSYGNLHSSFFLKLHSIGVMDLGWRPVQLAVYSTTDDMVNEISVTAALEDFPGKNTFAHCKYLYPVGQRTSPLYIDDSKYADKKLGIITVGSPIDASIVTKNVVLTIDGVWVSATKATKTSASNETTRHKRGSFLNPIPVVGGKILVSESTSAHSEGTITADVQQEHALLGDSRNADESTQMSIVLPEE